MKIIVFDHRCLIDNKVYSQTVQKEKEQDHQPWFIIILEKLDRITELITVVAYCESAENNNNEQIKYLI